MPSKPRISAPYRYLKPGRMRCVEQHRIAGHAARPPAGSPVLGFTSNYSVAAVDYAVDVLLAVAEMPDQGVSEIARRLGR